MLAADHVLDTHRLHVGRHRGQVVLSLLPCVVVDVARIIADAEVWVVKPGRGAQQVGGQRAEAAVWLQHEHHALLPGVIQASFGGAVPVVVPGLVFRPHQDDVGHPELEGAIDCGLQLGHRLIHGHRDVRVAEERLGLQTIGAHERIDACDVSAPGFVAQRCRADFGEAESAGPEAGGGNPGQGLLHREPAPGTGEAAKLNPHVAPPACPDMLAVRAEKTR